MPINIQSQGGYLSTTQKIELIPFAEIVNELAPLIKVDEAILRRDEGERELITDDLVNVKEMVWAAGEQWLSRDLLDFKPGVSIEQEEIIEMSEGLKFKAVMDVSAISQGTYKPLDQFKDERLLIDWKTAGGELSQAWRDRLVDSWQWRLYSAMQGASVFSYRGVSRRDLSTKEVIIKVPETNFQESMEYLRASNKLREQLKTFDVWPRNMPHACGAFGYECPYYTDCISYSMPRQVPEDRPMSYSRLKEFYLCPERCRRGLIETEVEQEDEAPSIGSAFHRGIAALYEEAIKLNVYG